MSDKKDREINDLKSKVYSLECEVYSLKQFKEYVTSKVLI